MTGKSDVTAVEAHYEFGENWRNYSGIVDERALDEAVAGLQRLLRDESLVGKRVLDLGCGSGMHSLAAARLGAREVVGIDIDPASVATAIALAQRLLPDAAVTFKIGSALDASLVTLGSFDVVYSWGVLHHTGNLRESILRAVSLVDLGGLFVVALYRRTACCRFWTIEKRWYRDAGPTLRKLAEFLYIRAYQLALWSTLQKLSTYRRTYLHQRRGMDFVHDVRDWLGGYPYESISEAAVDALVVPLGFTAVARWTRKDFVARLGALGSGCDEYVFRRIR